MVTGGLCDRSGVMIEFHDALGIVDAAGDDAHSPVCAPPGVMKG
jgi:hypothetical protein